MFVVDVDAIRKHFEKFAAQDEFDEEVADAVRELYEEIMREQYIPGDKR
jgi:hypothetical protein